MNKSESIAALASALAKAQAELKNPQFDSNNPHFKSKYASLAAVRDAVIPTLSKHGLSVSQWPIFVDGHAGCRSVLLHSSGEYMEETLLIPIDKQNAHGVGSATTYSRRFSLMAIAGVVGDEDDDGNAAVERTTKGGKPMADPLEFGSISPTADCWKGIPPNRENVLRHLAGEAIEMIEAGSLEDAYQLLYVENLDAKAIDNDEFVCVWDLLKPHSKGRNALKRMRQERSLMAGAAA
jgi:hypothetical protein